MFNRDFQVYKFLEVIEANSPGELKTLLAQIYIPYKIVWMYAYEGKHYAYINPVRPLKRPQIIKKSPRNTDKIYKEA